MARLAAGRHGVLTLAELLAAGLSKEGVRRRVAAGRLHRIHHGVYAVGHRGLSQEGRWLAATLACGQAAVLSHRSAAVFWKLLAPVAGVSHVTVPGRAGRARRPGIRIHRPRNFDDAFVTVVDGIRLTTVERTLFDLRGSVPASVRRRAVRQAEFLGLLRESAESDGTRSDLERRFLNICRRHRIPSPEVNVRIGDYTVDFLWRSHAIVIETDGYAAHRGRLAASSSPGAPKAR